MLSDTAEYALRAVLYIAQHAEERPLRAEEIAKALAVPRNYLSKILHVLAKEKVLRSTRGPHGGFQLAVAAERLPLHRIVTPFDPMEARRTCLLGRPQCSDRNPCPAHERWKGISEQVGTFFRNTTVAALLKEGGRVTP
ncbi:MAG TPA: Rrf2 family transcriptional regulator [Longimicrobiales bacterium]|nr:Rrf2 family transcriptional regulator [Longimicrobiales bacterium]